MHAKSLRANQNAKSIKRVIREIENKRKENSKEYAFH